MSRWQIPCECANSTALQIRMKICSSRSWLKRCTASASPLASLRSTDESDCPCRYFIVKNGEPELSMPRSCTGTMFGCSSWAVSRASRTNRSRSLFGRSRKSGMIAMATSRPVSRSKTSSTLFIPPKPTDRRNLYRSCGLIGSEEKTSTPSPVSGTAVSGPITRVFRSTD